MSPTQRARLALAEVLQNPAPPPELVTRTLALAAIYLQRGDATPYDTAALEAVKEP